MNVEIPKGNSREDIKARRQIIKEQYVDWVSKHPEKKIWNASLMADIHIKNRSFNEILVHAPKSYESTFAFTQMSDILNNATLVKSMQPKNNDNNQKIFSKMNLLRWKCYRLLVGEQTSTGELVLYYIGGGPKRKKIKAAR